VALVVLLRGINVGGHRTFRPSVLAKRLTHLDAVSIGAAGTFVIKRPVSRTQLRAEFGQRLPFDAEIAICDGGGLISLLSRDFFAHSEAQPDIVRFVSVLTRAPRSTPPVPMSLPSDGAWLVRILAREHRFVIGLYRRQMKVIRYLSALDRVFGVAAITRNWNTISAIAKVVEARSP
jgi:uncharacterized protein (DUF1697 family)